MNQFSRLESQNILFRLGAQCQTAVHKLGFLCKFWEAFTKGQSVPRGTLALYDYQMFRCFQWNNLMAGERGKPKTSRNPSIG
jgi:hypothetical protein